MTPAGLKLVSGFEAAAVEAEQAEAKLRKAVAEELARTERERAFAFRRARFVHLLASCASDSVNEPAGLAAQSLAVCEEFGWSSENRAHSEVLERLKPLGAAVWSCTCAPAEHMQLEAVKTELADFERWFRDTRGQPFYALFDTYRPETPLIDF